MNGTRHDIMEKAFADELREKMRREVKEASWELMKEWRKEFGSRLDMLETLIAKSVEAMSRPRESPIVNVSAPQVDNQVNPTPIEVSNQVNPTPLEVKNYVEQARVDNVVNVSPTPIEIKNLVGTPVVDNYVAVSPTPITVEQAVINVENHVSPTPVEVHNVVDVPQVFNQIDVPPSIVNVSPMAPAIHIDMGPVAQAIAGMGMRISVMENLLEQLVNRPKKSVVITHEDGSRSEVSEV